MGYYSQYELTISGDIPENLAQVMEKETEGYISSSEVPWLLNGSIQEMKWYDYVEHMERVSTHYPDLLFEIRRIGEDAEQSKAYFKNGKSQVVEAVIMFAPCTL